MQTGYQNIHNDFINVKEQVCFSSVKSKSVNHLVGCLLRIICFRYLV